LLGAHGRHARLVPDARRQGLIDGARPFPASLYQRGMPLAVESVRPSLGIVFNADEHAVCLPVAAFCPSHSASLPAARG
jgi:hypothetical protein